VIRDLIVDMTQFLQAVSLDQAYLINEDPPPEKERLQSPEEREELDGLYECSCARAARPPARRSGGIRTSFVGPAGLLQAYRFIADSRDQATLSDSTTSRILNRLFRCHSIMNCVDACPEEPQSDARHRQDQGIDGQAFRVT